MRSASSARPAILQIVPSLEAGGAERSTVDIAAALAQAGFRPLVASHGGRMVAELEAAGGEWIDMPVHSKSPFAMARNALHIRDLIRTRSIKLVHPRSRAPAWSAFWAARATGVSFVTTYHGLYTATLPLKRIYNSVMARADAVIANSEWTAAHIRAEYALAPKKLIVIPRGVDLAVFDPAGVAPERVARLRIAWGASAQHAVVLLPGRLTRLKGQGIFIAALARLRQQDRLRNIRAVIAGDLQGRSAYEQELLRAVAANGLEDAIAMAGHVADMPAAYLAADIVVSASTQAESFGRVAAEASAMKRPVIATDHGGARETILAGVSGLLTRPGDADALAAALAQLAALRSEERAAMGAAGRSHVARHFTVERMCADTLALYRDLIGAE